MAKGRIGLSLEPDVLAILNKYGRFQLGDDNGARPTRTEIIEDAVRLWDRNPALRWEGDKLNGATPDRSTTPPDDSPTNSKQSLRRERVVSIPKPGKGK